MQIQLIRDGRHYNVITDHGIAWGCSFDEALGVVASWLLDQPMPYVSAGVPKYAFDDDVVIAGLLTDQRVTGSTSMAKYVPRGPFREVVREKQYPYL